MPSEIVRDYRFSAESQISAFTGHAFPALRVDPAAGDALYVWAEQAEDELIKAGHPCPKLKIAQSLALTTDTRWLAGVNRPVSVSRPRHRVLARLARENRWQSIWTFNWDCHIEAALESVGITETEGVREQPWPTRYQRVLGIRDYGKLPKDGTVFVHKRHGCIRQLKDVEGLEISGKVTAADYESVQLRITKRELDSTPDTSTDEYMSFRGQIDSEFSGCPLVVCGWSASEKYILDELEKSAARLRTYEPQLGRLSVVDPVFNGDGHQRLSNIYDVPRDQAYFPIAPAVGFPDADEFFLQLQALYALIEVHKLVSEDASLASWLQTQIDALKAGGGSSRTIRWADMFLPAWVQLCWRAGLVRTRHRNRLLTPDEIRLEGEEWYVPLSQNVPERPELVAAAYILRTVASSSTEWRYDLVTGAFYDDSTARLLLPIPGWEDAAAFNVLNSLKRTVSRIDAVRGFVKEVRLVIVGKDQEPVDDGRKQRLKAAFLTVSRLPAMVDTMDLKDV